MRHTIHVEGPQAQRFPTDELEMGSIVRGHVESLPTHSGHFLRTYFGLVLLEDPNKTWATECLSKVVIQGTFIPVGAKLTIIVGGEDAE